MKMKMIVAGSVVVLAFGTCALAAKKASSTPKKQDKPQQVENGRLTDPNKVILVSKKDRTFTINLKSNPTTGYSWVLVGDYNSNMIEPISHTFNPPDTKLVGAPGYETFTFKVDRDGFNAPQKFQLHFQYVRPWVVSDNAQKLKFTIITKEGD